MDKEQAIEVLKPLANSYIDYANITMKEEDDDISEALEIAVDALKTQLSQEDATSDLISRQEAIDALDCINGVEEVLRSLPPAQPEPQWIPVSERLPEDLAEVITTWVNRDPLPYYEFMRDKPFTAVSVHYKGEWYWYSSTCADYLEEYGRNDRDKVDKSIEIIAWMPLPKPYKPNK